MGSNPGWVELGGVGWGGVGWDGGWGEGAVLLSKSYVNKNIYCWTNGKTLQRNYQNKTKQNKKF